VPGFVTRRRLGICRCDASEPLVTKPVPLIRRRTAFVTATASVHGSWSSKQKACQLRKNHWNQSVAHLCLPAGLYGDANAHKNSARPPGPLREKRASVALKGL